jgi:hypothetical protein
MDGESEYDEQPEEDELASEAESEEEKVCSKNEISKQLRRNIDL